MTGRPSSFTQDEEDESWIHLTSAQRVEAQAAYNRMMSGLHAALVGSGYDKLDDGPGEDEADGADA
jgi:hypothetical protein